MSKPVVPNIPPLSSIADPNTRLVLQAIIDQLNVRNGYVGTGEHKFLTSADLQEAVTGKTYGAGGSSSSPQLRTVRSSINNFIEKTIQSLTDQLQQSYLWKKLEERIAWIETPTWFQGKFGAAVESEKLVRESETQALASQITTAVTNINGNVALVQQELTATSNLAGATAQSVTTLQTEVGGVRDSAQEALTLSRDIDGQLNGSWSVKFQTGPQGFQYVTGVGLGITNETGAPTSSFIVKADNFAIGGPALYVDGVAQPTIVPFQVKTSPWIDGDGITHDPGVYMTDVKIAQATINKLTVTTELIAPGAITTEKIEADAVSNMVADSATSFLSGGYLSVSLAVAAGQKAMVWEIMTMTELGGSGADANSFRSRVVSGPATAVATVSNPLTVTIAGTASVAILLMKK